MAENQSDAMVARLEKDISERQAFIEGTVANAQDAQRDLTNSETELITEARKRIEVSEEQLETLNKSIESIRRGRQRADDLQKSLAEMRHTVDKGAVEYRSAGSWLLDMYKSSLGDREAAQRMDIYTRAAAHQKTGDNLGVVPDPIVGSVLNFIDAARPLVSAIGVQDLPGATFYRPRVTQGTVVDVQGTAGAAADEKVELDSQKMTISRLTATAVTYGGYVNVSRQNIDFSTPQILDIIINDLAARYAIKTEAAVGTTLDSSTATAVGYGASPTAATVTSAVWAAAGDVFATVKGQGRLILAVAPDRLEVFGPLFPPIGVTNGQSQGLFAGNYAQGVVGGVSGIQVVMSAGLGSGKAFLFSTAAIEVFEQRIGSLQAVEPSVLGVQVAYAGYFTPLLIENGGIIELTAS
jgi:HK97 family phage major capsid protein